MLVCDRWPWLLLSVAVVAAGCVADVQRSAELGEAELGVAGHDTARAVDYDEPTHQLTLVTPDGATELRTHTDETDNTFISDPNDFQGACRGIAVQWASGLEKRRPASWFRKLLGKTAHNGCNVAYQSGDIAGDGSAELTAVAPAP